LGTSPSSAAPEGRMTSLCWVHVRRSIPLGDTCTLLARSASVVEVVFSVTSRSHPVAGAERRRCPPRPLASSCRTEGAHVDAPLEQASGGLSGQSRRLYGLKQSSLRMVAQTDCSRTCVPSSVSGDGLQGRTAVSVTRMESAGDRIVSIVAVFMLYQL
jgi:hypothetical protein